MIIVMLVSLQMHTYQVSVDKQKSSKKPGTITYNNVQNHFEFDF